MVEIVLTVRPALAHGRPLVAWRAVRARNTHGWGAFSHESATFTTGAAPLPAPVVTSGSATKTTVSVAWSFPTGTAAVGFAVQTGANGAWGTVFTVRMRMLALCVSSLRLSVTVNDRGSLLDLALWRLGACLL